VNPKVGQAVSYLRFTSRLAVLGNVGMVVDRAVSLDWGWFAFGMMLLVITVGMHTSAVRLLREAAQESDPAELMDKALRDILGKEQP
jgi:Co/Zn/Cd efflux system component